MDTLCHQIPNFVEKAGRAGVARVFIGLENINPDSLLGAKKKQNRITDYRAMLQAWKKQGCITYAGYILGFPNDRKETIQRDIEIIKRELPVDILEFFILTPLPGSEDHKVLHGKGTWMDPDMNKYDLNHRVVHHPTMSDAEWEDAYWSAWEWFYSPEHMETIMRRSAACGMSVGKVMFMMLWFFFSIRYDRVHPLESGYFRLKFRRDRRPAPADDRPRDDLRRLPHDGMGGRGRSGCHTPRAQSGGRDISSCGTCHQLGGYSRTPEMMPAFRVSFSHAKHLKVTCNECHQVKAGMPQRRQVSTPEPLNHHATGRAQSCMTCHDGKRAFGGDDFSSCKRCHTGTAWRF